ncbi:filamentous hemagglutinin N-terminal domain-containing protein [Serratia odorifera]|uniref:filamentous hemagglutinin N-terminal domain-containing protein n=1 Tax=Serratia odorifera TaxID=618 RepID=UPI0018E849CE|nr:filamentous hemagglutinin N-terminal domain-containing protein [Serratia odorifera]MBJ2065711.1 filamentous hemagglutinin N-terminal domain-containing protein [Serratia odorifera]
MEITRVTLLSALTLLGSSLSAQAEITPQAAGAVSQVNQVPVVNINAPSQDGVSHNRYSQFDVEAQGAILNNSLAGAQTTLAGAVAGNSQFNGRAATVILNEVDSANKSILNGMVEVAGQRADVVIANKTGITCNGCGFINASNGVLTTGELQFSNGTFSGYRVEQGNILVDGQGMKKGDVDYTAIIARTANVNAAIHADALFVSAGKKTLTADLSGASNAAFSRDRPEVLIDVSELGGMYAGKIRLVANENGVGVNSANANAAQQRSGGAFNHISVANRGQIFAKGGSASISATTLYNQRDIGADRLSISATQLQNDGNILGPNVSVTATELQNNALFHANRLQVAATRLTNRGKMQSLNAPLSLNATTLRNDGQLLSGSRLQIGSSNMLNGKNGVIKANGKVNIQGTTLNNAGKISSLNSSVSLSDTTFRNSGSVTAASYVSHVGTSFRNEGTMTAGNGVVTNNGRDINKPLPPRKRPTYGWPFSW